MMKDEMKGKGMISYVREEVEGEREGNERNMTHNNLGSPKNSAKSTLCSSK